MEYLGSALCPCNSAGIDSSVFASTSSCAAMLGTVVRVHALGYGGLSDIFARHITNFFLTISSGSSASSFVREVDVALPQALAKGASLILGAPAASAKRTAFLCFTCLSFLKLINQAPPNVPPQVNKALIADLIKGNQRFS